MIRKILLSCIMLVSYAVSTTASITITENSPQRLRFVFELEDFKTNVSHTDGGSVTHIGFRGENAIVGAPGEAILPARTIHVGVPGEGDIRVGFSSLETRAVKLDAPLQIVPEENAGPDQPDFTDTWISQPRYGKIRGLRTAKLTISPIRVNGLRTATVLQKGVCTIEFPASVSSAARANVSQAFQEYFEDLLLNYSVARGWHTGVKSNLGKALGRSTVSANQKMLTFAIGDGHLGMKETTVDENGMVRIDGADILDAFSGDLRFEEFTLYAGTKFALSDTTPHPDSIPLGTRAVPVIVYDKNNNSKIDRDDYLVAYVSGTSDWVFDPQEQEYEFVINPYDDYRRYWLKRDNRSLMMQTFTPPDSVADRTVDFFENHIMYKNSSGLTKNQQADGGDEWIWKELTPLSSSFSFDVGFPGATREDGSAFLKIHRNRSSGSQRVSWNGEPFCDSCLISQWREITDWSGTRLRLEGEGNFFELEAIEVKYERSLSMKNKNSLLIYSLPGTGTVGYRLTNLPAQECVIVRVDQRRGETQLVARLDADQSEFTFVDSAGSGVRYFVAAKSALSSVNMSIRTPSTQTKYVIGDTRDPANQGDYLVIAPESMMEPSLRLVQHKQNAKRFVSPRVVNLDDIYRDFSGGTQDPTAIRNFLVFAANHWNRGPEYVVLMGNGNYDYKQFSTSEKSLVPTAIFGDKCVEDYFCYLDQGETAKSSLSAPDLFLGRITANNAMEANDVVDKIIHMEGEEADFGAWRGRVLLIADDDMQGADRDPISSSKPHHVSSEYVLEKVLTNFPSVDVRKVYLFEYPWDNYFEKPEAKRTLTNEINSGVGMVNFFGHGSKDVWADEHILANKDIGNLTNHRRYPIVTSFSCNVGQFDYPSMDCLSGALVKASGKGAIVAVSSARKAYAQQNENLAKSFYDFLTRPGRSRTVGQAYMLSKENIKDGNQKSYCLLGDPSIRLINVTDSVDVDILNTDGEAVDTLMALQTVTVRGKVMRNGVVNESFGTSENPATVQVALYNPVRDSVTRKDGGRDTVYYPLPGTPVFVGNTSVVDGEFEQTIFLPKRVTFNDPDVRLLAYAWSGENIAAGLKDSLVFDGTFQSEINDTTGPVVLISPVYDDSRYERSIGFSDRIKVQYPVVLQMDFFDENGIDIVGAGPDEGLTMEIEGTLSKRNINHKFAFADGDYRNGTATIALEENNLKKGTYDMTITAQDLLGNISKTAVVLEVGDEEEFKLGRVFNYPNPARIGEGTRFFFHLSNTYNSQSSVTIKVYTLSGKLIRIMREAENGQYWDLTDEAGNMLSPNIYLYRVSADANRQFEKPEKSPVQKLVVHPPR